MTGRVNVGEASPAIDVWGRVYSVGGDNKIHKYDLTVPGEAASWALPANEQCRTSPTIATHGPLLTPFVYVGTSVTNGGFGHMVAINTANSTVPAFSTTAGMWARAGLPYDYTTGGLYAGTGDASGQAWNPSSGIWSLSLIKFSQDGSTIVDSYTPMNAATLELHDLDLGSTNTLILPNKGTYFNYQHLALQSGKDGYLRLINLDNMSGQGGPKHMGGEVSALLLPSVSVANIDPASCLGMLTNGPCVVKSPMATWINPADNKNWAFINGPMGMSAVRVSEYASATFLESMWTAPTTAGVAGGAFVANGVLYYANGSGLHWVDATTGLDATGNFPASGSGDPGHQTPVVIDGVVYYNGSAYSLGGVSPLATNLALRRVTAQSSTLPGYSAFSQLAVDGNTNGNFSNGSVIYTNNEPENFGLPGNGGPWWEVNLGANHAIKKVVLFNRTDAGQSRISNFRIATFNFITGVWTVVYSSTATISDPVIVADNLNANGQMVLVQSMCALPACGTDDDYLNLAEVQVF